MNRISLNLSPPITKQQVLKTFQSYGYVPGAMINRQKMNEVLNAEYNKKQGGYINQDLLDEIWNQSQTTSKGEISINTIADIVIEAQSILGDRIEKLKNPNGILSQLDKNIIEKQQEVRDHMDYYSDDRIKINDLTKDLIGMQIQQKQNQHDLQNFTQDYETINKIFNDGRISGSFAGYQQVETQYIPQNQSSVNQKAPNNGTSNIPRPVLTSSYPVNTINSQHYQNQAGGQQVPPKRLLILFYLTFLLTLLQLLIISSLRVSMLTLTAYIHSFYILLLGMPNQSSITYLLVHTLLSVLVDISFLVLKFSNKTFLMPYEHSSNTIYIYILIAILIITIILRIISIVLWFPLRTTTYGANHNQNLYLMGNTIPLLPSNHLSTNQTQGYNINQSYAEPFHDNINNTHRYDNQNILQGHGQSYNMPDEHERHMNQPSAPLVNQNIYY